MTEPKNSTTRAARQVIRKLDELSDRIKELDRKVETLMPPEVIYVKPFKPSYETGGQELKKN